ncbi:hypothetical protein, partial [Acinetobacter baylyi]|uniref:hypothetical protein n=1 Tax=Acinetobacter baylyi TaxID=202950 RepID=UPI001C09F694
ATWSSVFGHCYILLSKPNVGAQTRAEEQQVGVRPSISAELRKSSNSGIPSMLLNSLSGATLNKNDLYTLTMLWQ